jgi:hypothetical protein
MESVPKVIKIIRPVFDGIIKSPFGLSKLMVAKYSKAFVKDG